MTKKARRTLAYSITIAVFVLTLVAMLIMRNSPTIAEWWSMNISRRFARAASTVSGLVPFSIFEWFIVFAVVIGVLCIIIGIALLVRHKFHTFANGLLAIALSVLIIANIYIMSAGFSYYRKPLVITSYQHDVSYEQASQMYDYYMNDFNTLGNSLQRDGKGNVIMPYSQLELVEKINTEFDKLDNTYYYSHHAPAKPILNSWLMSLTSILGVSFLPTGEANYNDLMPSSNKPHTVAHEIAHQRGVMREGDANTIAEYVLMASDDNYLRYCGYYETMPNTMRWFVGGLKPKNIDYSDKNQDKLPSLSDKINQELTNGSDYWRGIYDSKLYKLFSGASSFFNDLYLKLNGRNEGTGDYDNSGENVDSGKTDDDGNIIYKYELSVAERMYYQVYLDRITL